jgi:tetratricopeptide (TPR) repeat protein
MGTHEFPSRGPTFPSSCAARLLVRVAVGAVVAGTLLAPSLARAVTCDEVINMTTLNIPTDIVIQTIRSAATPPDPACLQSKGAPAEVIEVARQMAGGGTTAAARPPGPAPAPQPAAPSPSIGSFDDEETLGGDTFDLGGGGSADVDEADEPTGGGPAELEQAIELYRAKKPFSSSNALYEMLRDSRYPDQQTKIEYYLAKSLDDMAMYHSAQHYFMQVVRKGPSNPYFKYALPRLIRIAERTGNDYELLRIVAKIPTEAFPRQARSHLNYLLGRKLFERDELTDAAFHFEQVSEKSDLYMRSKYYEGIIHQQRGKMRSAVEAFRDVMRAQPPLVGDARTAQDVEDLKDLAVINIARIYYGLERFENADSYYSLVSRESSYWAESLFERGWTNFLRSDLNLTLGLLLTVRSPYFIDTDFVPEVRYLEALTFFNLCEFNEVERILASFDKKYQPMQSEIEGFLNQYRDQKDLWDQAYDQYFTNPHESSVLNEAVFARVLRNRDLAAMVRHLELMNNEVQLINDQKAQWRDNVGSELVKIIEEDRLLYKKKAGNELLREMLKLNDMLKELLVRAEIVGFEVVDAQRADYEFRAQTGDLDAGERRRTDFATSRDTIYWPFNWEFWRDELGYYRYAEHSSCN